jgi:hypothetical protein
MQFFKPENYFVVRRALIEADRAELIGNGPLSLIPSNPPKEALLARRGAANKKGGDPTYVHAQDAGVSSRGGRRKRSSGPRRR